jgi:hypothetical protein
VTTLSPGTAGPIQPTDLRRSQRCPGFADARFAFEHEEEPVVTRGHDLLDAGAGLQPHVDERDRHAVSRRRCESARRTAVKTHFHSRLAAHRRRISLDYLVVRRRPAIMFGERYPQLQQPKSPCDRSIRAVDDAAAGRGPLDIARLQAAEPGFRFHRALQREGHGLKTGVLASARR